MRAKRRYEALNTVQCHCDGSEDGHPLAAAKCVSGLYDRMVKPGKYGDDWCERDHFLPHGCPRCHGPARGICPHCEKRHRVVRIPLDRGFAAALGMAPHKVAGRPCPGSGQVPRETTYTPPKAMREHNRRPA